MPRKQDYTKGGMLDSKTPGAKRVKNIPKGVGSRPETGPSRKARKDVGFPGVDDSSLGPDDVTKSAK